MFKEIFRATSAEKQDIESYLQGALEHLRTKSLPWAEQVTPATELRRQGKAKGIPAKPLEAYIKSQRWFRFNARAIRLLAAALERAQELTGDLHATRLFVATYGLLKLDARGRGGPQNAGRKLANRDPSCKPSRAKMPFSQKVGFPSWQGKAGQNDRDVLLYVIRRLREALKPLAPRMQARAYGLFVAYRAPYLDNMPLLCLWRDVSPEPGHLSEHEALWALSYAIGEGLTVEDHTQATEWRLLAERISDVLNDSAG